MAEMGRFGSGGTWAAVALDDVEAIDWRRTGIRWHPVRQAVGSDIVGMAVFTAERPGELVLEPHTEVDGGRGQEEVYVVMRGAARFVIDGAEIDAPAGTFLRVEPEARRQATALAAGTAVLALGAGDEPAARAVVARLVDDLPELRAVLASDPDLGALLPE